MARSHGATAAGKPSRLKQTLVDGAAADTNIAVSGIAVRGEIVSVIEFDTGVPFDRTAEATVTSAGNIQLGTTDTTGSKLLVTWYQRG